jgi:hypothetical protein
VDNANRLSLAERRLKYRQHELGPQMRLHHPADDPATERIEHDGEVLPKLRRIGGVSTGRPRDRNVSLPGRAGDVLSKLEKAL